MQTTLDLFESRPEPPRRPWSVSRLNREVRGCLEGAFGAVWVEGEISNLRRQASGHQYFSLKDEASQVSCVMFRGASVGAPALRDGMRVEILGAVGVYEPRGQYQIIVRRVQARGAGELEARLRALQERLRAEGLFDPARKKPLPAHPARIGVVTSPTGAAIRDFLHILLRRAPHLEIFLAPVRVQGRGAAREIAAAVRGFSEPLVSGFPEVDVVVVTRGGGSLEDLWEFNEEEVARAIADCRRPVISAVGHEIDHTTSDLVADVRAPTPSAAAEILSTDRAEILRRLAVVVRRMTREVQNAVEMAQIRLERRTASGVFLLPARRISDLRQLADDLQVRAVAAMEERVERMREAVRSAAAVLRAREPLSQVEALRRLLGQLGLRQSRALVASLQKKRRDHARAGHALELLGPHQILARGFTMTLDASRRPLATAQTAAGEQEIITVFSDGEVISRPTGGGCRGGSGEN